MKAKEEPNALKEAAEVLNKKPVEPSEEKLVPIFGSVGHRVEPFC